MALRLSFDSPPLQALHRGGVLAALAAPYEVFVSRGVVDEMRRSREQAGSERVPDLALLAWLHIVDVGDADLAAAGAVALKEYRATTRVRIGERQIDRPELEAVLVARQQGARAAVEDKKAILCARDLAVPTIGTAQILCDLEIKGYIVSAQAVARAILATRYHTPDLKLLSSGSRRREWKLPIA